MFNWYCIIDAHHVGLVIQKDHPRLLHRACQRLSACGERTISYVRPLTMTLDPSALSTANGYQNSAPVHPITPGHNTGRFGSKVTNKSYPKGITLLNSDRQMCIVQQHLVFLAIEYFLSCSSHNRSDLKICWTESILKFRTKGHKPYSEPLLYVGPPRRPPDDDAHYTPVPPTNPSELMFFEPY